MSTKKKTNDEPELPESPQAETESETESPEGKNAYDYSTTSTTTATLSPDGYWRIKLVN